VWQSFDSPTDTLLPTQRLTASMKLVSTTGLHAPGHYIFHVTDTSILSLIYDDADSHEIYWPDPDYGEYQNNRNRYNSTRFGGLDDTETSFRVILPTRKHLLPLIKVMESKEGLLWTLMAISGSTAWIFQMGHGQFPGLQCLSHAIFMACVVQMGSAATCLHLHALAHLGM
jgi:hypothetical protein